jgi:hypothetical protein
MRVPFWQRNYVGGGPQAVQSSNHPRPLGGAATPGFMASQRTHEIAQASFSVVRSSPGKISTSGAGKPHEGVR